MSARSVRDVYVPVFDGMRGLISITIAVLHVQLAIGWFPQGNITGSMRASMFFSIEFLFLVGGFAAFMPIVFYERFSGARSYAIRRAGRILPLYLTTILLAVILGPFIRDTAGGQGYPHDLGAVLVHVAFLQQMVYPFKEGFGVQGIIWTMSTAACFYVVFPLIARGFLRRPLVFLAGAIAITLGWRYANTGWHPNSFLQPPLFAADFAIGMAAAVVYVRIRKGDWRTPSTSTGLAIFGVALVALVGGMYLSGHEVHDTHFYWHESAWLSIFVPAMFAVVMVSAALTPRWFQWPLENRPARFVGSVSFGLFLFHFLVIWTVLTLTDIERNGSPRSVFILTAIVLPVSIFLGWLGTRFIEDPLRARAHQLAARRPGDKSVGAVQSAPAAAE